MIVLAVMQAVVAAPAPAPTATAFAQRCAELRRAEPTLTCERLARKVVAGHPIEVWETSTHTDDPEASAEESPVIEVFVAIQTHAGWYVDDPIASFRTEGGNGMGSVQISTEIGGVDVRAARAGGHRAVRVRVFESWNKFCEPCDDAERHTSGVATDEMVCVLDELIPRCDLMSAAP